MNKKVEIVLSAVDKTQAAFANAKKGLQSLGPVASVASAALARFGIGLPATLAAVAGGALLAANNTAEVAREVKNFAALSGTSTEEFSALAYAADRVGISQEKLADIFKDTQDKVGDFIQNGGGPLKDFFDNIAPRVGVTADQFRRLSGPEALQLYVASLQKANLSQSDLVFYMEAIASDSARLLPLLQNNGAEFAALADEARSLGVVMEDEAIEQAVRFGDNLKKLQGLATALRNDIGNELIPTVNRLAEEFVDARKAGLNFVETINSIWRTTPLDPAEQVRDLRVEIEGLNADLLRYQQFGGDTSAIDTALASANRRLEYFKARQRAEALALGEGVYSNEGRSILPASPELSRRPADKKKTKKTTYTDPLADEAKAYAQAMQQINAAQIAASTSGMQLTATQQRLVELVNDPVFSTWPEQWQLTTLEAAKYAVAAEQAAAEQARLNELIGNTESSKIAAARSDMELLTAALQEGRITEAQYIEATRARLQEFQGGVDDTFERTGNYAQELFSGLAGALTNFNDDIGESFERTVVGMIQRILQLETEMALMAAWKNGSTSSSSGIGGILSSVIGSAFSGVDWFGAASGLSYGTNAFSQQSMMLAAQSFAGGGDTGPGARIGGLDGKGGYWAIMHPQETIIDRTMPQPAQQPPRVEVVVNNHGTPQTYRQTESRYENGRLQVSLIAADVLQGGELAQTLETIYPALRRPGV